MITRNDADALIPVEVSREIIQSVPKSSVALQILRKLPNMSAKQTRIPVLASMVSGGFVTGDTGLKPLSDQSWENKFLNAEEIAVIIPIPEAVLADSDYDIWGEIKPRVVESFGKIIDGAIFFGEDKPAIWPAGLILQAIAAGNVINAGSTIDIAGDISAVMAKVEADGFAVNGITSDVLLKANLRDLRATDGTPIFQPSLTVGTPGAIYGVSYQPVENGSWDSETARVLLGDFSNAVYSIRQDITYKILDQAVLSDGAGKVVNNLAMQDMVALRCVMRLA